MKTKSGSLGDRMKMYEGVFKHSLMRKTPVIIRLDGKAFHTFTRGFKKPWDELFVRAMQETTLYLCENIQGCVFGYTQSDEITLVLCDYQTYDTAAWFDYEVQKLCSVSASMCTFIFNRIFNKLIKEFSSHVMDEEEEITYMKYKTSAEFGGVFDSRCFNVPTHEVINVLIWRQQDATRNSIQMLGQSYFSHKELEGKNCNDIQDMVHEAHGVNWNDIPTHLKRGTSVIKNREGGWYIDYDMPILTQDREYVESRIRFNEGVDSKSEEIPLTHELLTDLGFENMLEYGVSLWFNDSKNLTIEELEDGTYNLVPDTPGEDIPLNSLMDLKLYINGSD